MTAALDTRVPDDTIKLLLAMSYEAMPGKLCSKRKGAAFNWCVAKKKGRPYLYDRAAEKQSAGDAGEKRKENPPQDRPAEDFLFLYSAVSAYWEREVESVVLYLVRSTRSA